MPLAVTPQPTTQLAKTLAALHEAAMGPGWTEQDFKKALCQPHMLVQADHEADPAAVCVAQWAADTADIVTIAVHPDRRRKGLGRAVLKTTLRTLKARGVTTVHLEVNAKNTAALNLYAKTGFIETGRRSGYYSTPDGPEDAVMMKSVI